MALGGQRLLISDSLGGPQSVSGVFMADDFRPLDRDTPMFLPPSIQEWLPEQHLARFVVEIVDQLDLSEIASQYAGSGGKRAYHPALLVALLFYGYATGVFSSRKLEQATHDSVAFRYISGDEHPDHDTIANFRKRFLAELQELFKQILEVGAALGVLRMGTVSLDGSKVQGNASKHKAMSWGHANKLERQLEEEVQKLLKLAEQADQGAEQEQQELDIPEELERREERLAAIREVQEKIIERAQERHEGERAEYEEKLNRRHERAAKTGKKVGGRPPKEPEAGPREKDQVNFTDEESRIMPGANGEFVQGYNAQAVVDHDSHLVVGNHVSQATNDKQEVEPALTELGKVEEALGKPAALVADAGYHSKENVEKCMEQGIDAYIAGSRERHNQPLEERMKAPPKCPADADAVTAMQHRMQTAEGKAIYGKRKATVETVFGVIKEVLGFRRFHLRGLRGAEGEWSLVCTAWNLKRLYVLVGG